MYDGNLDVPNNSDEILIEAITCYSAALPHATSPEETLAILDILLSGAQELYRRTQEHANA